MFKVGVPSPPLFMARVQQFRRSTTNWMGNNILEDARRIIRSQAQWMDES